MTIYKLDMTPDQDGYGVQRGTNFNEIQTGSGNTRIRRTSKNAEHIVTVHWTTNKDGYDLLQAFYRLWEQQEPKIEHFVLDLILDTHNLIPYRCYFVAGGAPNLVSVSGFCYKVSAQLRVRPKISNKDQDEMIVLGVLDLTNILAQLVNEDLPNAMGDLV